MKYRSYRFVDGKARWVIVDENGKIIDKNSSEEDLKNLESEKYIRNRNIFADNELLNCLKDFYEKNGRIPVASDLKNNPGYPSIDTYQKRFGSWNNALKLVGLDVDAIIKQGNLTNSYQKGRWAEIIVRDHFENKSIDLSGNDHSSPYDGICPNRKTYEVKSAGLRKGDLWIFIIENKYKEEIEWFYLLAFNEDYTELMHVWRLAGEIIETNYLTIGMRPGKSKFNVKNLKEYDIIDKFIKK